MKRPALKDLTLRQKIGQTGFPSPKQLLDGVIECKGYDKYFQAYPFVGAYLYRNIKDHNGQTPATPEESAKLWQSVSDACQIPLLICADGEHGANYLFDCLHQMPTMLSLGAAQTPELTYQRSYYYAKELKACGVNWSFSPVCDLNTHFLAFGLRKMSEDPDVIISQIPALLQGYRDAGIASTAKHYPGPGGDFRDSHVSSSVNKMSLEDWNNSYRKIWQAAVDAGAPSVMISHHALPCVDDSRVNGNQPRPATASKKVLDILRYEMGFQGVIVTDAVSMKGIAGAFEHEDVYIECFNAGNDMILFCKNDYFDIMEKAVLDGRVSMERLDESVERILDMKQALGLFDEKEPVQPLTEEENKATEEMCYEVAQKAITVVANIDNMLPFDPKTVKNAVIIKVSANDELKNIQVMIDRFAHWGIHAQLRNGLASKEEMKQLSEQFDLIIFASEKIGKPFYDSPEERRTLISAMTYGAKKTVVVSFGVPTIYYMYFEQANAFLNTYCSDAGTMKAVVDGILGAVTLEGTSPVRLTPHPFM